MKKVTKKKQIEDLQTAVSAQWRQINKLKLHLGRLVDIDWSDEQADYDAVIAILDGKEPQLKQLDQSSFKEWADCWKFFAIDKDGAAWRYREEPKIDDGDTRWSSSNTVPMKVGEGYDASDWQNSLIERDNVELTGSDLARAMLARGDSLVMCRVSDRDDAQAKKTGFATVILVFGEYGFEDSQHEYKYAIPINNQGEPLTAADVGL